MKSVSLGLCAVALLAVSLIAAEEAPKFDAKCPVSGKAALKDKTAEYKGAHVYFCCENCPAAFAANTAKYAAKANHQLAQTGQFVEVKCPLTGRPLNKDTAIDVSDVSVAFCCNNCKAKASGVSGNEQLELVFADTPFGKGYEIKKAE